MGAQYEWDVEVVDPNGDIEDHLHQTSFADCVKVAAEETQPGYTRSIVLVRDDDKGRSWAYLEDGALPEELLDAYDRPAAKTPQRFRKEVERHSGKAA